jgi:hypothetical protein
MTGLQSIDVSGDGGIMKEIITAGTGDEFPPVDSKVKG